MKSHLISNTDAVHYVLFNKYYKYWFGSLILGFINNLTFLHNINQVLSSPLNIQRTW